MQVGWQSRIVVSLSVKHRNHGSSRRQYGLPKKMSLAGRGMSLKVLAIITLKLGYYVAIFIHTGNRLSHPNTSTRNAKPMS
jgi:hypothetical protein